MMSNDLNSKCHWCQRVKAQHTLQPKEGVAGQAGEFRRVCPDGSGRTFKYPIQPRRASFSISDAEVDAALKVVAGLPLGADLRVVARNPAWASFSKKIFNAQASIRRREREGGK